MDTDTLFWLAGGLFVYFFPTYLAYVRGHLDWKGIFFINVLAGWTIVMWLAILVWALDPARKN